MDTVLNFFFALMEFYLPKKLAVQGKHPVTRVFGLVLYPFWVPLALIGFLATLLLALAELFREAWKGTL